MPELHDIAFTLNGEPVTATVEARQHLADFLRQALGLTGTHIGCEHGVCGACNVMIDGRSARSCLTLAVQADGAVVETIEGLTASGAIADLQSEFVAPQRAAMRLLHARDAGDGGGAADARARRRGRKFATRCPATTAAARAITRSSMRSRRCIGRRRSAEP